MNPKKLTKLSKNNILKVRLMIDNGRSMHEKYNPYTRNNCSKNLLKNIIFFPEIDAYKRK